MNSKTPEKPGWRRSTQILISSICAILFFLIIASARSAGMQFLHNRLPTIVAGLQPLHHFANTNTLDLAIGLPLRNKEALTNLLQDIYDPHNPNYHHYLTVRQFTDEFGPTEEDYQAVIAFAKANGLLITGTHANRLLVDVKGSVTDIERALHTTLRVYQHPTEKRTFYAPDVEPSLNLTVPVLGISGLNNYALPHPRFVEASLTKRGGAAPNVGTGPGGGYLGNDFRAAYAPDSPMTGMGQTVGLLQFDGYTASDIAYYENLAGLPNVPLTNVLINGFSGTPSGSGGEVEVSLDIEMAISMAPGLSKVIVYEAPNPSPWEDILNRMVTDNLAKQISCSWYAPRAGANPVTDQIFQEMAAQGQSFFNASGDNDAYTGLIDFPGDSPYITQVGGTTLTTSNPGGAWASETVWNWGGGTGSGGGISTQYPIPDWQTNVSMVVNHGSTTMRNTPDVAMTADNVYVRANGHDYYHVGGTSCAAPLWAGFAALVNQQAVFNSVPTLGFVNPMIYTIGSESVYDASFHDITTGDNIRPGSGNNFYAVAGYDLCTGWGTPAGQNLIDALVGPPVPTPPTLISQPTNQTIASGNTVRFAVTANGSFPLSYQWSFNETNIIGATNNSLSLANVDLSQSGDYAVLVTNAYGSVPSSNAVLTVLALPPTIIAQPTNQSVYLHFTVNFGVTATGSLPLSYQWNFNGTNLVGATNAVLTLANVQYDQAGAYAVEVTNQFGSTNSVEAILTVNPPPPCEPPPAGLTAWWPGEGSAVDVVGDNNGVPVGALSYTNGEVGGAFVFDGSTSYIPLPASPSLNIGTGSGITIECWMQPASAAVNGPLVEWDYGTTDGVQLWSENRLRLYANIEDTSHIGHTLSSPNDLLQTNRLQQVALTYDKSSGAAVLYWNGMIVASTNFGSFTPQTSFPLNIGRRVGVLIAQNYTYGGILDELSLYNRALSQNEVQGIYVAGVGGKCPLPVTLISQPADQTAYVGTTVAFNVVAGGSPPLTYQWEFNGTNILGGTKASLILTNVQPEVAGVYSVTVSNLTSGASSTNVTLTVNPPPPCEPPPAGLTAWWPGEGSAVDVVGGNNGVPVGALSYTNGEVGGAFVFDGSTSYIPLPASPSLNIGTGSGITIECWMQPASAAVNGPLVEWDYGTTDGVQLWVQPQLQLYANVEDTTHTGHTLTSPNGLLQTNRLQHVALTYDKSSGEAVLYWDGTVVGSANLGSFTPQTSFPLNIGRRVGVPIAQNFTYGGILDELSLYNRALSQNEVQGIYAAGVGGKCPLPVTLISQPTNQTVKVGSNVSFSTIAGGSPPFSYQWNFNGTNLLEGTNVSLVLTNVQLGQAGHYAVKVTNPNNSVFSSNATLTVYTQDHFAWDQIPSPRFVGVPFSVAIQTQDATNGTAVDFNGTVTLTTSNGIPITPSMSDNFVQGAWSGLVTVSQVASNVVLRANDGLGETGLANPINVVNLPQLSTLRSGTILLMLWPTQSADFVLETTDTLSPPQWVPVPVPPVQVGDQYLETIQMDGTNRFYRLRFTGP